MSAGFSADCKKADISFPQIIIQVTQKHFLLFLVLFIEPSVYIVLCNVAHLDVETPLCVAEPEAHHIQEKMWKALHL